MFAAYPDLMNAAEHDGPTRAFVAGYITHLLADETYIVNMFRPFFGEDGVFEDSSVAKVWDRALQLDLDREVWQDVERSVGNFEVDIGEVRVQFLPQEDLQEWRDWVFRVVSGGFSWERLRFMARRIASGEEDHPAYEHAERFIESAPDSLDSLYDLVPRSRVDEFKSEAVSTLASGIRGYLA